MGKTAPHRMALYANSISLNPRVTTGQPPADAKDYKSWYQTPWWRSARREWLKLHKICVMCRRNGTIKKATVVDHQIPHRGNPFLFFNWHNLQSLCYHHHNSIKQASEARGAGARIDGSPVIPQDGW